MTSSLEGPFFPRTSTPKSLSGDCLAKLGRIVLNPDDVGRDRDRDTIEVHPERQKCEQDTMQIAKERGKLPFEGD